MRYTRAAAIRRNLCTPAQIKDQPQNAGMVLKCPARSFSGVKLCLLENTGVDLTDLLTYSRRVLMG